jgi:hypothetical protein
MKVMRRNRRRGQPNTGFDHERHDERAHEQPADGLDAALHADGLAGGPEQCQRGEDAEEVQRRREDRHDLFAAYVRETLEYGFHSAVGLGACP